MAEEETQEEAEALLAGDMTETPGAEEISAPEPEPAGPSLDELQRDNPALERALGIPLDLSAVLADKIMRLEEVLNLYVGAVIQFEKGVEEPLELRINGITIALGETVTIGERNFALQLIEVAPPQQIVGSFTKPLK